MNKRALRQGLAVWIAGALACALLLFFSAPRLLSEELERWVGADGDLDLLESPAAESPAAESRVVATLPRGLIVRVTDAAEGWVKVAAGSLTGWVAPDALSSEVVEPPEDGLYLLGIFADEWLEVELDRDQWVVIDRCGPGVNRLIIDRVEPLYPEATIVTDYSELYYTVKSVKALSYQSYAIEVYERSSSSRYETRLTVSDSGIASWENLYGDRETVSFAPIEQASEFVWRIDPCE